jgi:hypothetical protein
MLSDQITRMLHNGRAGSYVEVTKKAIVAWLDWNGKRLMRRIRIPGAGRRPTLKDAHIPTQDELRGVLNVADVRARTATTLIAFSGLRPEVLGTYTGDDGLRLSDFKEASISRGRVVFETVPTIIEIPARLSKNERPYFTFLGQEGCDYLAAYFRERAEDGERITEESSIITPKNAEKDFIRTLNIGDLLRKPMRAAGLKEPPYIWRSYFSSRAMLAEGRGLTRDFREFMMGHSGDVGHVYALHKKLPPDTVETMRRGYKAALPFLETTKRAAEQVDLKLGFRKQLLAIVGVTQADIDKMDLAGMSDADLQKIVRDRLMGAANGKGNGNDAAVASKQTVVPLSALGRYLQQGWLWVAQLPDDRAVITRRG